jgi:hypothetical protein
VVGGEEERKKGGVVAALLPDVVLLGSSRSRELQAANTEENGPTEYMVDRSASR